MDEEGRMGRDEMSWKEMKRGRVLGMKWLILPRGDETVSFEIDIWYLVLSS